MEPGSELPQGAASDTSSRAVSGRTIARSRSVRVLWGVAGWLSVALGFVGLVVPGLPSTVFFIIGAWCFSHSSPRFEAWILSLPKVGPLVDDYRNGLGMSRAAKRWATGSIVVFSGASCFVLRANAAVAVSIAVVAVVGVVYILVAVPTREAELARRALGE